MKVFISLMLVFASFNIYSFELSMNDLNGELSQGQGDVSISSLDFYSKPVGTKFDRFVADFTTDSERLFFNYNGQIISLDLGIYKKIFEKQIFYIQKSDAYFKMGKKISLSFDQLNFGLEKLNVESHKGAISCEQKSRRGLGDELVELCLDQGSLVIDSVRLGDLFNKTLKVFSIVEGSHLPGEVESWKLPKIQNIDLSINDGVYSLKAITKIIGSIGILAFGDINYDREQKIIDLHLKKFLFGRISLKGALLKTLKFLKLKYLKVEGDHLKVFLNLLSYKLPKS
jgi:hypothetical protein